MLNFLLLHHLYAVSKYSSIGLGVQEISVPLGGHGETFAFGIIATIDDENVSIQKIDFIFKNREEFIMTDYTKTTNFLAKDSLPDSDTAKIY